MYHYLSSFLIKFPPEIHVDMLDYCVEISTKRVFWSMALHIQYFLHRWFVVLELKARLIL